jgi:hypothetical protein
MKRQAMEFGATQRANKAQAEAISYKNQAQKNMDEGLGLLSSFIDQSLTSQRERNKLLGTGAGVDIDKVRQAAQQGAEQISSGFLSRYGRG